MSVLVMRTSDPQLQEIATGLLAAPCIECGATDAPCALLLDADDAHGGPFTICETCAQRLGIPTLELPRLLLACRTPDEFAPEAVFRLELARHWNEWRVPLRRNYVYEEARWPTA